MRSLQARLSIGLTLSIVLLIASLLLVGQYLLRQLAETFVATRIEQDIEGLLTRVRIDPNGQLLINNQDTNPIFNQPYSGHYYQIRYDAHLLRSRSLWDTQLPMPIVITNKAQRNFLKGPENQQLLALSRRFYINQHVVTILLTEDITDLTKGIRQLLIGLGLAGLLILMLLLFLQNLIVRCSLRPLLKSQADIQRLAQGEIQHLNNLVPSEIQPFIMEINRLIGIMQQRLQRSHHALGNLAHALKTPLARITQMTEQSGYQQNSENSVLHPELSEQTTQIGSLIERELKRARIVGSATPGQRVIMMSEVNDLVLTLEKIYLDKALVMHCMIPANSWFPGNRDDLLELLGNLLDNAYKWATHQVRLKATTTNNQLQITIEDDGLGCSAEQIELLTRRGVRIDETTIAGHGLGLAIVNDIVEQYSGQLQFSRSMELGGLRVDVILVLS